MTIFVPALLKMEVVLGVVMENLTGPSSGWASRKVLDMVPEKVPGWVLVVGTQVVPEEVPGSLFEATSCNPGATLECPPLGIRPSQSPSRHRCLVA